MFISPHAYLMPKIPKLEDTESVGGNWRLPYSTRQLKTFGDSSEERSAHSTYAPHNFVLSTNINNCLPFRIERTDLDIKTN